MKKAQRKFRGGALGRGPALLSSSKRKNKKEKESPEGPSLAYFFNALISNVVIVNPKQKNAIK